MIIKDNDAVERLNLPGLTHQTLAGPRDGMRQAEVWMQVIEPGCETPLHRHDCEEVVVVLEGSGSCVLDDGVRSFGSGSTLIVPPNIVHKIVNSGDRRMLAIAVLTMAPVRVETPEGERLRLPWDQERLDHAASAT